MALGGGGEEDGGGEQDGALEHGAGIHMLGQVCTHRNVGVGLHKVVGLNMNERELFSLNWLTTRPAPGVFLRT